MSFHYGSTCKDNVNDLVFGPFAASALTLFGSQASSPEAALPSTKKLLAGSARHLRFRVAQHVRFRVADHGLAEESRSLLRRYDALGTGRPYVAHLLTTR
jgi:hypothetical protein